MPACGSSELARIGAGTQRLEAELEKRVPELERIRLDADTAAKPGALREALDRFAAADRAVLVGTQMVAKGHHFPGVSLAAVVDADTGLAIPDFRAEERTFQLVTQLAGRSGRDAPGKVIVQTFQPDATPLRYAARHDVAGFLAEELDRRRELGYPPFRHLISIVAPGTDAEAPERLLRELNGELSGADLLGPAPLLRLRGRHRAQLVAKTDTPRALAAAAGRAAGGGGARDAARRGERRRRCRPPDGLTTLAAHGRQRDCARAGRGRRGPTSGSSTRRIARAAGSRSPRSASTRTRSCGCARGRSSCSTTTSPASPRRWRT